MENIDFASNGIVEVKELRFKIGHLSLQEKVIKS